MSAFSARTVAFAFALSPSALIACVDSQPAPGRSPAEVQVDYRAQVTSQLEGSTWRLAGWQPEQALESMFQSLLREQLATMTIRFAQGHVHADSLSIHIDRGYQVVDAAGPQFVVVTNDEGGGTLRTTAQFAPDGRSIYFHGETEPWRGNGTLVKSP
jgi:hypothetical protein